MDGDKPRQPANRIGCRAFRKHSFTVFVKARCWFYEISDVLLDFHIILLWLSHWHLSI